MPILLRKLDDASRGGWWMLRTHSTLHNKERIQIGTKLVAVVAQQPFVTNAIRLECYNYREPNPMATKSMATNGRRHTDSGSQVVNQLFIFLFSRSIRSHCPSVSFTRRNSTKKTKSCIYFGRHKNRIDECERNTIKEDIR